jgi:hypothetical protein
VAEEKKSRKGFETGGKISSAEEWEELEYYWVDKSFEERMQGLFGLIEIYLAMNSLPLRLDKSIAGRRNRENV